MGCITVKHTPIGGISCKCVGVDQMNVNAESQGGISASAKPLPGISASAKRVGGISCRVYQICSVSIREPYLEISPTVIWVLAGQTYNDVFSNTFWNIH